MGWEWPRFPFVHGRVSKAVRESLSQSWPAEGFGDTEVQACLSIPAVLSYQLEAAHGQCGLSTNSVRGSEHSSWGLGSMKFPVVGGLQGTFSWLPHPKPKLL